MNQPEKPYNNLPTLDHLEPIVETREVLKLCIEARAELAELRGIGTGLPNQQVLTNTLPLIEAQASSEIENVVTTRDELFRQSNLADGGVNSTTKEALRYRTAMRAGLRSLEKRPMSTPMAVEICTILRNHISEIRTNPGTELRNSKTGEIIYTPPVGEDVIRDLLSDLFSFMTADDVFDPIVRMAIGHYQFEAIHPFTDGNGRTGRILNVMYLVDQKILDVPTLYLSGVINERREDYYALLNDVTRTGKWHEWLMYMLLATRDAALRSRKKCEAITQQVQFAEHFLREKRSRFPVKDLISVIYQQPYCRIQNLVDAGIGARQASSRYLHDLIDLGLMREEQVGREKLFVNKAFLNLLLDDTNPVETFQ